MKIQNTPFGSNPFKRGVAIITVALFLLTSLSNYAPAVFAQPINLKVQGGNPSGHLHRLGSDREIRIPPELGLIDESFHGTSGKTVVYLQDAHDSLEAQENIAKIINHLVANDGVKTVFEEGYEGPVPTDKYFGFIKDPKIREKVSYFLMDHLRVGGAEYAHINRTKNFNLIGADSLKLHKENIAQYRKSSEQKKLISADLTVLEREIKCLANLHFPKELKEWIRQKEPFDGGQLPLPDYLKRTAKALDVTRNNSNNYPIIRRVIEAEKTTDKAALEKVKNISAKDLFVEIERMEKDIVNQYLRSSRDRETFEYYRAIQLLKRLNDISLSFPEYQAVKDSLKRLDTKQMGQFIGREIKKTLVLSKRWEKNIREAIEFYEIAQDRDNVIAKQMELFLTNSDEQIAILVFGGFHKNNIKEILKKRGASCFFVSPKIIRISKRHQDYYKQLMTVGRLPFELPANLRRATRSESRIEIWNANPMLARAELRILEKVARDMPGIDPQTLGLIMERTLKAGSTRSEMRDGLDEFEFKNIVADNDEVRAIAIDEIKYLVKVLGLSLPVQKLDEVTRVRIHGSVVRFEKDQAAVLRQKKEDEKLNHLLFIASMAVGYLSAALILVLMKDYVVTLVSLRVILAAFAFVPWLPAFLFYRYVMKSASRNSFEEKDPFHPFYTSGMVQDDGAAEITMAPYMTAENENAYGVKGLRKIIAHEFTHMLKISGVIKNEQYAAAVEEIRARELGDTHSLYQEQGILEKGREFYRVAGSIPKALEAARQEAGMRAGFGPEWIFGEINGQSAPEQGMDYLIGAYAAGILAEAEERSGIGVWQSLTELLEIQREYLHDAHRSEMRVGPATAPQASFVGVFSFAVRLMRKVWQPAVKQKVLFGAAKGHEQLYFWLRDAWSDAAKEQLKEAVLFHVDFHPDDSERGLLYDWNLKKSENEMGTDHVNAGAVVTAIRDKKMVREIWWIHSKGTLKAGYRTDKEAFDHVRMIGKTLPSTRLPVILGIDLDAFASKEEGIAPLGEAYRRIDAFVRTLHRKNYNVLGIFVAGSPDFVPEGYGEKIEGYLKTKLSKHYEFSSTDPNNIRSRMWPPTIRAEGPGGEKEKAVSTTATKKEAADTAMVKVADIGIFKDHLRAYRQISEAIDQGKIPIGLPLILVDEHSDNRNSTAEGPHDGNWLTFLKEEGKISDAFWVWPEGRKHEIRYEGHDRWFRDSGSDFENIVLMHIDQLRHGVILSIDQDYFASVGGDGFPSFWPEEEHYISTRINRMFEILKNYGIPVYLVNGALTPFKSPQIFQHEVETTLKKNAAEYEVPAVTERRSEIRLVPVVRAFLLEECKVKAERVNPIAEILNALGLETLKEAFKGSPDEFRKAISEMFHHQSQRGDTLKAFRALSQADSLGPDVLREGFKRSPFDFVRGILNVWRLLHFSLELSKEDSLGIEILREKFSQAPFDFGEFISTIALHYHTTGSFRDFFQKLSQPGLFGIQALREKFKKSSGYFLSWLNRLYNRENSLGSTRPKHSWQAPPHPEGFVSLEIGPEAKISPFLSDENIEAYARAHIIRTDTGDVINVARGNDLRRIEELGGKFRGKIEHVHNTADQLLMADGSRMPDEFADEVLIANVLGYTFFQGSHETILREIRRVLKKSGELIIVETYTPTSLLGIERNSDGTSVKAALLKFAERLTAAGFTVKVIEAPQYSNEEAWQKASNEEYMASREQRWARHDEAFLKQIPHTLKVFGEDELATEMSKSGSFVLAASKRSEMRQNVRHPVHARAGINEVPTEARHEAQPVTSFQKTGADTRIPDAVTTERKVVQEPAAKEKRLESSRTPLTSSATQLREPMVFVVEKARTAEMAKDPAQAELLNWLVGFAAINKNMLYIVVPDNREGPADSWVERLKSSGASVYDDIRRVRKAENMVVFGFSNSAGDSDGEFLGRLRSRAISGKVICVDMANGNGFVLAALLGRKIKELPKVHGFHRDTTDRYRSELWVAIQSFYDSYVVINAAA